MNNKGFTLIEIIVSSSILLVGLTAVLGAMTYYTQLTAKIKHEQQLFAQADALLASFQSKNFCNQQLGHVWSGFPGSTYKVKNSLFTFDKLTMGSQTLNFPDATFPQFPLGKLKGLTLSLENPPVVTNQLIVRATVTATFHLKSSEHLKTRSTSIFLSMDGNKNILSCLTTQEYAVFDWQQHICDKLDGNFQSDGTCNMGASSVVKRKVCEELGKKYSSGKCDVH